VSPFRLEVSDHAEDRLKLRGITRQLVRQCIAKGKLDSLDVSGRLVRELNVGRKTLVVVNLDIDGGALLVTAYWRA
jgi:hypothetical protein